MDCSEATTMLDELALDVLPGDQRAALLAHVADCRGCRDLLDELSETADALLLAAPSVVPPAGFGDRVLERIEATPRSLARPRSRPSRLRVLGVAAVAAALLGLAGFAGDRLGSSGRGGAELATTQLISATGTDLGDVVTYDGDPHWFFMRVEGPVPDGVYSCVLDTDDGKSVAIGKLWASHGHGGWGEDVAVDPHHVIAARMVDSTGATVATARFS